MKNVYQFWEDFRRQQVETIKKHAELLAIIATRRP